MSKNDSCSLYFVSCAAPKGITKVGISADPRKRLATLKTASPYTLSLFASVSFSSRTQAEWAERVLHVALAEHRMAGEWFSINASIAFRVHEAISEMVDVGDFDPDDFVGLCQMTAFQCLDAQ